MPNLEQDKAVRIDQVKKKTNRLNKEGFTYDSENFQADSDSLTKYMIISIAVDKSKFTLPHDIRTVDNGEYEITNQTKLDDLIEAAIDCYMGNKDSGRALIVAITAATEYGTGTDGLDHTSRIDTR